MLVLGATGKSAQIPLYVWLPDAMEGPTPVSALIHAATMVTAGVYMVVRTHALFDRSPLALSVVAVIGAATAFFAATVGIVQTDIKRVLAYSTISQLGYMFLACGAAAYSAAIFHLITHAFFKALLFLAAGSVIHALGGEQDMRNMGGLRKNIPVTFWTMTMAVFAISGFPPFAGFFSKDAILAEVFRSPNGGPLLWSVGIVTAAITSFYMFRLWYMTFFGHLRLQRETAHHVALPVALDDELLATGHSTNGQHAHAQPHGHGIHESPWSMLVPLVLLAVLSVAGGWIGIPHSLGGSDRFARFLDPVTHGTGVPASFEQVSIAMRTGAPIPTTEPPSKLEDPKTERMLSGCSVLAALLGWLLADTLYRRKPQLPARMAAGSRALYGLVVNKYWIDEIYGFLIVKPLLIISRYILWGGSTAASSAAAAVSLPAERKARRRIAPHSVRQYPLLRRLARHRRGGHSAALLLWLRRAHPHGGPLAMTSIDHSILTWILLLPALRRRRRRLAAGARQAGAELDLAHRAGHLWSHAPSARALRLQPQRLSVRNQSPLDRLSAHSLSPRRRRPLRVARGPHRLPRAHRRARLLARHRYADQRVLLALPAAADRNARRLPRA